MLKHESDSKIDSYSVFTKIIGQQLQAFRKALDLNQKQISDKSGLTPARIVELEHGKTNYKIETLITYLRVVGRDFKDLSFNVQTTSKKSKPNQIKPRRVSKIKPKLKELELAEVVVQKKKPMKDLEVVEQFVQKEKPMKDLEVVEQFVQKEKPMEDIEVVGKTKSR